MSTQASRKPVEQIVAAIEALDLAPIKFKLMNPDEGQGWSQEKAERIERDYRRFLTLLVKYPDTAIAPSLDIDKFWHGHILDTMKYAEDCEQVFGYFLHHYPYFGMKGEEDAARQVQADQDMKRLYEQEFGESMAQAAAYCSVAQEAAYCSAAVEAAYCSAAVQAAYCSASSKKAAYCSAAVKAAYCSASTKAAYCSANEPAYCSAAVRAAYCSASTKAAYCSASAKKAAYCSAAVKAAYCSASTKAAYCSLARAA